MNTRIKIRGIYSTALTRLVLDSGYSLADPSAKICERFGIEPNDFTYHILIEDREDHQGVELYGEPERICQFITFFQERLLDSVLLELIATEDDVGSVVASLELPGAAKKALDEIRSSVVPTLNRHHRLRAIDAKILEQVETDLVEHSDKKESLEKKLFFEAILLPLEKSGVVRLEHVRPSGKPMRPREGALITAENGRIVFRRSFSEGRYDGLDIAIRPGDYGLTDVVEGAWYVKHDYFRKDGKLIGEYYNINTPVELYPYGARYMDLEVDVIRRAGEEPFLVDREKLSMLSQNGCIGSALETKAMEVAEGILKAMQA